MVEVTAPGKVLLLGGYAVLEGHPALSVAMVDRKWHGADAEASGAGKHRLVSKEFGIDLELDTERLFSSVGEAPRAHRIAVAAHSAATAYLMAGGHKPERLSIQLSNSPIFGGKEEKSGLGSSAASSVALVAAVFEGNGLPVQENRDAIHKVAQLSHAMATGWIGSGFDVATSAFGTISYTRYLKGPVAGALEGAKDGDFGERLKKALSMEWPGMSIEPRPMEGFSLLVFNIRGAKTSTISSVRAVRKMAEYVPELYQTMLKRQADGEKEALEGLRRKDGGRVREGMHLARAAQGMMTGWVRRVGMMGFDQIEPEPLARVIEKAERLEGVVAGRCPGSGGYDSVAFVVEGDDDALAPKIREAGRDAGLDLERIEGIPTNIGVRRTDKEMI